MDAKGTSFEAQTENDLFTNMEVAASPLELQALYATATANSPALLIPYSNLDVIRSFSFVPSTLYLSYTSAASILPAAPTAAAAAAPVWNIPEHINLEASRGQYLVWQLAVVVIFPSPPGKPAQLSNIKVGFSDLVSANKSIATKIPASKLTCFNTDGVDPRGVPFNIKPFVNLTLGSILPLWLGVDIDANAVQPGSYDGFVTVTADSTTTTTTTTIATAATPAADDAGGRNGSAPAPSTTTAQWTETQHYRVVVVPGPALVDRGDKNASLLSKVRYLNSDFGIDNTQFDLPPPFTPVTLTPSSSSKGAVVGLFSKAIEVSPAGLLSVINVTTPPYAPRRVVANQGMEIKIPGKEPAIPGKLQILPSSNKATAAWSGVQAYGEDVVVTVNGTTAYDGYSTFVVAATPTQSSTAQIDDLRVSIPLSKSSCTYMMKGGGSGAAIGAATAFEWKWTSGGLDNLFYVGGVQSGMRLRLKGAEYAWDQPRGPFRDGSLPSNASGLPKHWYNGGRGGVSFTMSPSAAAGRGGAGGRMGGCLLEAYTGPLTLVPGVDQVLLHFDLVITPNKPLDVANHFKSQRYYQVESSVPTPQELKDDGVKIVNIHQGNVRCTAWSHA